MRVFVLTIYCVLAAVSVSHASKVSDVKDANKLYEQQNYKDSVEKFSQALGKDAESDIINFGLGTAYYKNNQFKESIDHLRKSLLSDDAGLKQKGHYNLGNALYKHGIGQEESNIDAAIASLEQALAEYDKALTLQAEDTDAKANREFVARELERLKQKKEQQEEEKKQDKQQSQDKQQKDQKNDQEEKQDGQNQDQQNKDEEGQGQQQQKDNQDQGQPQSQDQQKGSKENQGEEGSDNKEEENKEESGEGQSQKSQDDEDKEQSGASGSKESPQPQDAQGQSEVSVSDPVKSEKDAQRILDEYIQVEEPKGLFNPVKNQQSDSTTQKDW